MALTMTFSACSADAGEDGGGQTAAPTPERPTGPADALTVVDTDRVAGVEEHTESHDPSGVDVTVSYPSLPNSGPLDERLDSLTDQRVNDFVSANPGAKSIDIGWELTAAAEDVVGVRLSVTEKDSRGSRTGYETLWYEATTGQPAVSTELLDDQEELETLTDLVRERLDDNDEVDGSSIVPITRLFDSIGFNPEGDLVVEFDEGQVAPPGEGRVSAIVEKERAEPLLSGLGERALSAATTVPDDFTLAAAPSPKDGAAKSGRAPAEVPGALPPRDDSVDCSDSETKCVALTFDDGPGGDTPRLLDTLAEHDAKATFFVTGEPSREHLRTVRREYAEGHELANHTMTHADLSNLSRSGIERETAPLQAMIRRETGYTPVLMRPPYGATDSTVSETMAEAGMAEILWNVDTLDWRHRDPDRVAEAAVEGMEPGAILLFHDIHTTTVDAVPEVLRHIEEKGYTAVTVSELLGDTEPGETYTDGRS